MKSKKSLYLYLLVLIGILILLNILANSLTLRLDFTQDKRYTLSDATKGLLENLEAPVTITAYLSADLPPEAEKIKKRFKELLVEYAKRSDGMVEYTIKNPNEDDQIKQEAVQKGIQPSNLGSGQKDKLTVQTAFLGATIQYNNQQEVIPFLSQEGSMEYELSSRIKKVSIENKPLVGLLQGHGEPSIMNLSQVKNQLSVLYNLEPVTLDNTNDELSGYKTLAIISPTDSFAQWELDQLDQFLANGNNLFIAINRVEGNMQQAMGSPVSTGLENWLQAKGIQVNENFLVDEVCQNVRVGQQGGGGYTMYRQVPFPYLPLFSNFADHPVTSGLEIVAPEFASTVNFTGDTSKIKFTPLIFSSSKAGTEPAPTRFSIQREWQFPMSGLTAGAAFSGQISNQSKGEKSKMIVIGDGDFPVNKQTQGRQRQQLPPDNVNLMSNSIDWLSDVSGLIELRSKGITARPLKEIDENKKTFLKYFNFLLPIIIIILIGVIRMERNRNLRIKRMEEDYVQ